MNKPKRHHYVPRFLLEEWAGKDKKIICYSRPHDKIVANSKPSRSLGQMKDLYTLHYLEEDQKYIMEVEFFSQIIDEPASIIHKKFLKNIAEYVSLNSLTSQDRKTWAQFIISLRLRGPFMMAIQKEEWNSTLKRLLSNHQNEYEEWRLIDDPINFVDKIYIHFGILFESAHKPLLPMIIQNTELENNIMSMHWYIFRTKSLKYELITSDNPVIISRNRFILSDDQKSQNFTIAVPLSPKCAFIASKNMQEINIFNRLNNEGAVKRMNEAMASNAKEYIYARNRHNSKFIERREKILRRINPDYPS